MLTGEGSYEAREDIRFRLRLLLVQAGIELRRQCRGVDPRAAGEEAECERQFVQGGRHARALRRGRVCCTGATSGRLRK